MRMRRSQGRRPAPRHQPVLPQIVGVALVIALVLLVTVLLFRAIPTTVAAPDQGAMSPPTLATRSATSHQGPIPIGSPAIPVRTTPTQTGAYFTAADAAHYVVAHKIPRATESGPHTVISVEFMTNGELNARLGGDDGLGIPTNVLVCYVVAHGTFTFPGPMGFSATYHRVYLIFNAQNGYFLSVGGID